MEKRYLAILFVLSLLPTTVLLANASTNSGNSTGNCTISTGNCTTISEKQCGKTVTFTYHGVTKGVIKYEWHFGDGKYSSGKTLSEVSHTYKTVGRYVVNLYVKQSNGKWKHISLAFRVK